MQNAASAVAKRMMNFLGQMRGICLTQMLKERAGSNHGSMKRLHALKQDEIRLNRIGIPKSAGF
jgi:hypothetical protein